MALLKNHPEIDLLAGELSKYTGESAVQATIIALRERIAREQTKRQRPVPLKDKLFVSVVNPRLCQ